MAKNDAAEKAKQKEFYHEQRLAAEEGGDQSTVNKIYGKLGKKAPQVGGTDRVDNAILGATTLAGGGGAGLLSHIGGAVLSKLFPEAADQISAHLLGGAGEDLAEGMVPKALGGGRPALARGRGVASAASRPGRSVTASERGVSRAEETIGGKSSNAKYRPGKKALPPGRAASRTKPLVKAKTVQRISREKNVTPKSPIKSQPPKALPRGQNTGPNFKQPAKVKAGTPRAKQTSARAKGTNPRALGKSKRAQKVPAKSDEPRRVQRSDLGDAMSGYKITGKPKLSTTARSTERTGAKGPAKIEWRTDKSGSMKPKPRWNKGEKKPPSYTRKKSAS